MRIGRQLLTSFYRAHHQHGAAPDGVADVIHVVTDRILSAGALQIPDSVDTCWKTVAGLSGAELVHFDIALEDFDDVVTKVLLCVNSCGGGRRHGDKWQPKQESLNRPVFHDAVLAVPPPQLGCRF